MITEMNIKYISSTCSRKKYTEYIENKGARVSQQAQKYNFLLAEGLVKNGCSVELISSRPINRSVASRIWFGAEKDSDSGIEFSYVPFVNYPILRNIFVLASVFLKVLFSKGKRKDTAVVCDALNIVATMGALAASTIRRYKTVGIVTDVPCHLSNMKDIPFSQKLNLSIMKKFKSYLLLTEPMSDVVNPRNLPYIVLEGHADSAMVDVKNLLQDKAEKKICLYAGSLKRVYGIENLVKGFISANVPNTELHIYGNGDYVEELKQLSERYETVKYFGVAPNKEIVEAELRATLLVNPRPTNEEYTKYSFPSKNMEYMASGTPVLTTKLPGMPADHIPYVYLIEDETSVGIASVLTEVLSKTPEELWEKGNSAKEFILKEKNNIKQAQRLLRLINNTK